MVPPPVRWHEGTLLKSRRLARAAWRGLQDFNATARSARRLVYYAETAADWAYLGPMVDALEARGERVLKITSDAGDSVLKEADAFFVGSGFAQTALFKAIQADVFVMTLTDLERLHLKRSVHPVHYVYAFHSIASTHRVYWEHAFDAYDTIHCVGPHHVDELRRTEQAYGLRQKRLVPHGYGRLDTLMQDVARHGPNRAARGGDVNVLLAPSWGDCSIVKHCLEPLIDVLIAAGFRVAIRLHPMTRRHDPSLPERLVARIEATGRFQFDPHINTTESVLAADIMITESSGAPLEYAFARERPVIFIDTPPKINNPHYARVGAPLLEVDIREKIGRLVRLDALDRAPHAVRELVGSAEAWAGTIRRVREATVFNVGRSGAAGPEAVLDTLSSVVRR